MHWRRKTLAYKEYLASGRFNERYNVKDMVGFKVLVVAPSAKRVESIKAAAEKYGSNETANLFLLARFDQMGPDMLTAPIWAQGGTTQAQALL